MGNYGIKIAEPDFDVRTASDENLSLKSGLTLLKVYKQGAVSLSGNVFSTIDHSLAYIPQYLVFVKYSGSVYLATGYLGLIELPIAVAKMDASNLYILDTTGSGSAAFYYIFYEPVESGDAPAVIKTNNYGIIISKDGKDVREANILEQTFNSEKNSLKILFDNTYVSEASGSRTVNIEHGMDFIPGFLVFYEVDNSGKWIFQRTTEDISGKECLVDATSNTTYLSVSIYTNTNATVKIHYYVLADPGEEVT